MSMKRIFQKNRQLISKFFKTDNDDAANQEILMESVSFYCLPYFSNLSINSKREKFQFLTGRTDNSNSESDELKPYSSDTLFDSSRAKDSTKQKKSKNESPYYEFNNAYFSKFCQISRNFYKLSRITYLSLQNCCLTTVPKQLFSLPKDLISLDLSNNYISKIPPNVSWKKLKRLNLFGNLLREWPSIFEHEKIEALEYLNVGSNLIETINSSQTSLHSLKTLILSNNNLTEFPLWIIDCQELVILNISQNSFMTNLDLSYLCVMPNLKILDISSVKINKVPLKMSDSLQILILSKNLIKGLPMGDFQLIT